MVGPPTALEAFVVVDHSDVNFVGKGQKVRLQVDEAPGHVLVGTIVELANLDLKVVPRELAKASEVPVRLDEKGVPHPLATSYQARVALDESPDAAAAARHPRPREDRRGTAVAGPAVLPIPAADVRYALALGKSLGWDR